MLPWRMCVPSSVLSHAQGQSPLGFFCVGRTISVLSKSLTVLWLPIKLAIEIGPTCSWLQLGASHPLPSQGHCLSTECGQSNALLHRDTRWVEQCDDGALQRWVDDDFCCPPYQKNPQNYVTSPENDPRLPVAEKHRSSWDSLEIAPFIF